MNEKSNQLNQSNGQALWALWVGVLLCLFLGAEVGIKVFAAIFFLSIATIISFRNYDKGVIVVLWVIALGVLNLVDFFPIEIGLVLTSAQIGVDFVPVAVGFIHYYANEKELAPYMRGLFKKEVSAEEKEAGELALKNHFKKQFATKGTAELQSIAMDDKYLPMAIEAAEELLEERRTGEDG